MRDPIFSVSTVRGEVMINYLGKQVHMSAHCDNLTKFNSKVVRWFYRKFIYKHRSFFDDFVIE